MLACGLLAVPALAQKIDFRRALPASTILYVGAPDLDMSLKEFSAMPLAKIWREAEVQDFFADALEMGRKEWAKGLAKARKMHQQGGIPVDPDKILELRLHGLGFALTSLDVDVSAGRPMPRLGAVVYLDFGPSAASWRHLIEFGLGMLEQRSQGMLRRETSKVGGVEIVSLVPPVTDMALNLAFVGDGLLLGSLRDEVKAMLAHIATNKSVLTATKNFDQTFAHLDSRGAEAELYLQPEPLLDFGLKLLQTASDEGQLPPQINVKGVERAIDALGLHSLQAFGLTSSYEQGRAVTMSYALAPMPLRKGLFAGGTKELDTKFLRWVPRDAGSFSAMSFDVAGFHDAIVGALKAYDEEQAGKMLALLSTYEKQLGVSLREDLIGSIGHELITWSMPVSALGTTPEVAFLLQMKNQERFVAALQTLTKLSDGRVEIEKSRRRGIEVYQVQLDIGGGMGMNPLAMFVPTFAFKDGYLVAGFSAGDVKRTFKRMDRPDEPAGDIRSNQEFAPYLGKLPKSGIDSLSFTDWKASFESIYQALMAVAAFIPVDEDIPIDLSLMPEVSTLTQHLFGSVAHSQSDGMGYTGHAIGPFGPEVWGTLVVGAAVGVGFASLAPRVLGREPGRLPPPRKR